MLFCFQNIARKGDPVLLVSFHRESCRVFKVRGSDLREGGSCTEHPEVKCAQNQEVKREDQNTEHLEVTYGQDQGCQTRGPRAK